MTRAGPLDFCPQVRSSDQLLSQELDGELLIYDLERHKVHCLNATAAWTLARCNGSLSVATLTSDFAAAFDTAANPEVIWHALSELERARLLLTPLPLGPHGNDRRAVLNRLAKASLLIPAVSSIIAPRAAQAASCAGYRLSCMTAKCCGTYTCSGAPLYLCV